MMVRWITHDVWNSLIQVDSSCSYILQRVWKFYVGTEFHIDPALAFGVNFLITTASPVVRRVLKFRSSRPEFLNIVGVTLRELGRSFRSTRPEFHPENIGGFCGSTVAHSTLRIRLPCSNTASTFKITSRWDGQVAP